MAALRLRTAVPRALPGAASRIQTRFASDLVKPVDPLAPQGGDRINRYS